MMFKGLKLDKFQEDAVHAIDKNHSVIVSAPTGSGKTLIADYIISRDVQNKTRVIYTAPIKALSNQKYKDFCKDYGPENVGLLTGDIVKNPDALILIMTTEIYRNMLMSDDEIINQISYVIFDEIHFISDIERGYVWEESIIFSKEKTRFLCLSATIPNAREFANWISLIKNHKVEVVETTKRPVPLNIEFYDTELGITTLEDIKDVADIPDYFSRHGRRSARPKRFPGPSHIDLIKEIKTKTPCLFFTFSRLKCERMADELYNTNIFSYDKKVSELVSEKLAESPPEISELKSTILLKKTLSKGIGFHHAGLIPALKDIVEDLFCQGLIKVLYSTETFAVGINMPAKTVCFDSLRKFDGITFRFISSKEFFQISGRAGRRGIDTVGYVYPMITRQDFEYSVIKRMVSKDVEPIKSRFKMSPNTVINLIKNHTDKEIGEILCKSFDSFQRYGSKFDKTRNIRSHDAFDKIKRKLSELGDLKDNNITSKGIFTSKIYCEEYLLGEIFFENFYEELTEYQLTLMMACICYESREDVAFKKVYHDKKIVELKSKILKHDYIKQDKRFNELLQMTALIHPCFNGGDIFDVIKNTQLPEGDLLRFYRTLIDRFSQVRQATKDHQLAKTIDSSMDAIRRCIELVDVV